eukprot:4538584-Alexandrium_andersonii.AAC.1
MLNRPSGRAAWCTPSTRGRGTHPSARCTEGSCWLIRSPRLRTESAEPCPSEPTKPMFRTPNAEVSPTGEPTWRLK